MHAIADTGYLVALVRKDDQHHGWATSLAAQFDLPLLTCEAVLSETAFHLDSSAYVLAMLRRGAIRVAFDCTSHLEHLHDLATTYADRSPDLADLCLIRMSELYPHHTIITVDADFRVYRRNKREAIPLLTPPKTKK
jgi:predicted nucleic acid-binding protein